jgi:hypothetical protein
VKIRSGVAAAVAVGTIATGCGGDEGKESEAEQSATPQQAMTEIGAVRKGLEEALATYKSGDKAKADEQVGDAYLEHFEHVEGPLGKADHELNETLEDSIREELREKIKDGAPPAEVEKLHAQIKANLIKAEAALR